MSLLPGGEVECDRNKIPPHKQAECNRVLPS